MYTLSYPIGLNERVARLGGFDRAMRLSLLQDGYQYLARNKSNIFYLICFKDRPVYSNGIFLKSDKEKECERIEGETFRFMQEKSLINLKTMEIETF